jgi:hypothetical protein
VAELNQNLARAERQHLTNIIKKITYAHYILIDIPHEWIIYDKFNLLKNEDVPFLPVISSTEMSSSKAK